MCVILHTVVEYAILSRGNCCHKFKHFGVQNFQASKYVSVKKMTNIRYVCQLQSEMDENTNYFYVLQSEKWSIEPGCASG